jgi:hypothetical protein
MHVTLLLAMTASILALGGTDNPVDKGVVAPVARSPAGNAIEDSTKTAALGDWVESSPRADSSGSSPVLARRN